jgi:hypothetical protein
MEENNTKKIKDAKEILQIYYKELDIDKVLLSKVCNKFFK